MFNTLIEKCHTHMDFKNKVEIAIQLDHFISNRSLCALISVISLDSVKCKIGRSEITFPVISIKVLKSFYLLIPFLVTSQYAICNQMYSLVLLVRIRFLGRCKVCVLFISKTTFSVLALHSSSSSSLALVFQKMGV